MSAELKLRGCLHTSQHALALEGLVKTGRLATTRFERNCIGPPPTMCDRIRGSSVCGKEPGCVAM
eukprot:1467828-Amphidinium_carterae.1